MVYAAVQSETPAHYSSVAIVVVQVSASSAAAEPVAGSAAVAAASTGIQHAAALAPALAEKGVGD